MASWGLSSFLKKNSKHLSVTTKLHNQTLIIEGKSLAQHVFEKDCKSRMSGAWRADVYGGNMVSYSKALKSFFEDLNRCNIKPIVVISRHVINYDEELPHEKMHRLFVQTELMSENSDDGYIIAPPCIDSVFYNVVKELRIELLVVYNYKTSIRLLTDKHLCNVLSDDSELFLYRLQGGLIFLDSFTLDKLKLLDDGKSYCIPNCCIYKNDKLLKLMPKLDLRHLPLLSMLVNWTTPCDFTAAHSGLSGVYDISKLVMVNEGDRRIVLFLGFLRGRTLREILEAYEGCFKPLKQSVIEARFLEAIKENCGKKEETLANRLATVYRKLDGCDPASYLAECFTSIDVNTILYDMIFSEPHVMPSAIENSECQSSSHVLIRPYSVALCLLRKQANSRTGLFILDRPKCHHILKPMDQLTGFGSLKKFTIYKMMKLPLSQRKLLLCSTFHFNEPLFHEINRLFTPVMNPGAYAHEATVGLLLVRYITIESENLLLAKGNSMRLRLAITILISVFFYAVEGENSDGPQIEDLESLKLMSVKKPKTVLEPQTKIYEGTMVLISELQAAYKAFCMLNSLLDYPFQQPKLELFFNGVLIYRLTKKLSEIHHDDWFYEMIPLKYGFGLESSRAISLIFKGLSFHF